MSDQLSDEEPVNQTHGTGLELLVILPAYNEQESIRRVITEWGQELRKVLDGFKLLVIDDGSTDGTLDIIKSLAAEPSFNLEWITRPNRGHGQTCMQGYQMAVERDIPYVLQIDSDGQCDPKYFRAFWDLRNRYDIIYGSRKREDGFRRVFASLMLRIALLMFFRVNCLDANVPYRLMNTHRCTSAFRAVPSQLFLANVGLAVALRRTAGLREGSVSIRFRERYGGEPSVPFSRFAARAIELFRQLGDLGR